MLANLQDLPFAPSVAIQEVPQQSVGDVLAQRAEDDDDDDDDGEEHSDLDDRIQSCVPLHTLPPTSHHLLVVVRRAYDGRIEVDSASGSDIEDVHMSDVSTSSSSDGALSPVTRRTLTNGFGHDRYGGARVKRKFFRSSLIWDPILREARNKIAVNRKGPLLNRWS